MELNKSPQENGRVKLPPPICLPMRAAAIFQLSGPSALIGTR